MQVFGLPSSYYPQRPGGVASSRSEDPGYRSGEKTRRRSAMAASHGRWAQPAIARRARSVRRAPISIAGEGGNASKGARAASRRACASPSAHPVSSRRSSACATISPCGAAPSSARSCASEGFAVSDATVGRIIAQPRRPRRRFEPVPALRRRPYARRWTAKRRFARRLPRDLAGQRARRPRPARHRLRQSRRPTKAIKHFTAYDPIAKWTVGKAFNRATASPAAIFLDKIVADMPFPGEGHPGRRRQRVHGRVRGRLRGQGRRALRPARREVAANERRGRTLQRRLAIRVLRHLRPARRSVEALNPILDSFQHLYNHHRPDGALGGRTPSHYLAQRTANDTHPSHMS